MTTINVTKKEFTEISQKAWGEFFEAAEKMPTKEEIEDLRNETYKKLKQYNIVLSEKTCFSNVMLNELIETYCDNMIEKDSERKIFTGHSLRPISNNTKLKNLGFVYQAKWSDVYREVFINDKEKVVLTFCEGDISFVVCNTTESYNIEIQEAEEFYKLN